MRLRYWLLPLLLALLLPGCSSTRVQGSWKDPEFRGQLKTIYIVGISKEETRRRLFEDEFRRQLAGAGVTAIPSYRDLPDAREVDKDAIAARVTANGADAVLLTRVVGRRTEQLVSPGRISTYDYGPRYYGRGYYPGPYYRRWDSFYDRSFDVIVEPPTVTSLRVVTLESNLYLAGSGELVWAAQLEVLVEGSLQKMLADFVKTVTRDLRQQGLL